MADEAFFCGSGYEITPITSIDRFPLGDGEVGPMTQQILEAYLNLVRGWIVAMPRGVPRPTIQRRSECCAPLILHEPGSPSGEHPVLASRSRAGWRG